MMERGSSSEKVLVSGRNLYFCRTGSLLQRMLYKLGLLMQYVNFFFKW